MSDFRLTHCRRMAFVTEKNIALHPLYIGLFGLVAVMPDPDRLPELIHQFGLCYSRALQHLNLLLVVTFYLLIQGPQTVDGICPPKAPLRQLHPAAEQYHDLWI